MQLQKRSKSYDWNKKNSLDETRYRPGNSSECFASKKGPQNSANHDVLPERWREVVAVHELNASLQISEVGIGLHACSHKEKYAVAACPAASVLSSWQHWQATSSLLRSIWEGNHPKQFVRPTTNARSECEV